LDEEKTMNRVSGKVTIITGGASGIGEAAAKLLAAEGARVAITDIDDNNGQRVTAEINAAGNQAEYWHMNIAEEAQVSKTFAAIQQRFGKINVLVNNAGISGYTKLTHETTSEEWDRVIDIDLKGTFLCVKYAVPYLIQSQGGSVINISSIMGIMGGGDPVYHAAKGGVRVFTKSDASGYGRYHIRFNSIHPGFIITPLFERLSKLNFTNSMEEQIKDLAARIPLGRPGTPRDIANGILFLASDESEYITGTEMIIDGGYSLL
jgi:NAD(P)-dependent dehydrogenase (short-subunit alcohol dehydrogenase family)